MSLLVICDILGLFFNTMTADDKYSLRTREILPKPIEMQLSNKQKCFSHFFAPFRKYTSHFKHSQKKVTLIAYVFPKL